MQIKIYDYDLVPLTTLQQIDLNNVTYETQISGDGSLDFECQTSNEKLNSNTIQMYNRVKLFEGSKCVFYGLIIDCTYTLNIVSVKCVSLSFILKRRLINSNTVNGTFQSAISQLIFQMNAYNETGISIGTINLTGSVNKTYNNDTVEYVLSDIIGSAQWYIDENGALHVSDIYGQDKSQSVQFKYDTRQIQSANLANFSVKENGQNIYTEILGKDKNGGSQVVQSQSLIQKYGIIQSLKTYSHVYSPNIAPEAQKDLSDRTFSPDITLVPLVQDNFSVGDIVTVRLYNRFVDINTPYQVIVKTVSFAGNQKTIRVRLNDKQKTILDILKQQENRITQLENN